MLKIVSFKLELARSYRKRSEVMAFRADADFSFHKSWGQQQLRAGSWVLVPLDHEGLPSTDIYGCDAAEFADTYEPSPSGRAQVYRKRATVLAYAVEQDFSVQTQLADGHVETTSATGVAGDWLLQAPGGECYPVAAATFLESYEAVPEGPSGYWPKSRDGHWAADGQPKRILSLDGGGVRGILSLGVLSHMEAQLRARHGGSTAFRLCDYFDLIVGTSTGAIIAAALARGMAVQEIKVLYDKLVAQVFQRDSARNGVLYAKYSAPQLKNILDHSFGAETQMDDASLRTGLLVVTKRLDTGSVWPLSNNPKVPFWEAEEQGDYLPNRAYRLAEVVRASTAAPSYFDAQEIDIGHATKPQVGCFVDGGVSPHNNPALLAMQFATQKAYGAGWELGEHKLLLVSVGTGSAKPVFKRHQASAMQAIDSLKSMMNDCAELNEELLQWMSRSPTARHLNAILKTMDGDLLHQQPLLHYLRYDVPLQSDWLREHMQLELDEKALAELAEMDRPEHAALLYELGCCCGESLKAEHFPACFDLLRAAP